MLLKKQPPPANTVSTVSLRPVFIHLSITKYSSGSGVWVYSAAPSARLRFLPSLLPQLKQRRLVEMPSCIHRDMLRCGTLGGGPAYGCSRYEPSSSLLTHWKHTWNTHCSIHIQMHKSMSTKLTVGKVAGNHWKFSKLHWLYANKICFSSCSNGNRKILQNSK